MAKWQFHSKTWNLPRVYNLFLHITLFFMVLEIGMELPFSVFEYPFAITGLLFFILVFRDGWGKAKERICGMGRRVRASRWMFLLLGIYILIDAIGILYSPAKDLALTKYAVILPMAGFSVLLLYYCDSREKIQRILLNIGASGTFLALFTLFNYFVVELLPIPYYRRLSMLTDYNRFASVVFTSFLLLLLLMLDAKLPLIKKYAAIAALALVDCTVLSLSGSRRTYLSLIPALVIVAVFHLVRTAVRRKKAGPVLKNALALVLVAGVVFSFNAAILCSFQDLSDGKYEAYVEETGDPMEENSIETIVDSIGGEGVLSKRAAIWSLALEEASSYSPLEMLVGKGTSYEAYLYDIRSSDALDQLYAGYQPKPQYWMTPHNFLLSDFLSGGFLKLAASLAVWGCIGVILLRLLRRRPGRFLFYATGLAIVFINCMISGRYTYVYDKHFWLFFVLLALEWAGQLPLEDVALWCQSRPICVCRGRRVAAAKPRRSAIRNKNTCDAAVVSTKQWAHLARR